MKVGIVSPWYERGVAFISLDMLNVLAAVGHEVHVLAPLEPEARGESFNVPNLTRSWKAFKYPLHWALERELDALIFNERLDCRQLSPLREHFATIGLLQWEFVPQTEKATAWINRCYDAVIAPTRAAADRYTAQGIQNVHYVPWGTDLDTFRPPAEMRAGPLRFLHPANYGGLHGRKNVTATMRAWELAQPKAAELTVHLQDRDPRTRSGMAALYRAHDVALLPSLWEGLGLCFLESLASGLALVTVDAQPMRSHVVDGTTGFVCRCEMLPAPPNIHVPAAHIDLAEYAKHIGWLAAHPWAARRMGQAARAWAVEHLDWAAKGSRLMEVVEGVLNARTRGRKDAKGEEGGALSGG